jgi:hypothetical protein
VLIARFFDVFSLLCPPYGPPLWEDCDAQAGEGSQGETDWELVGQPAPDYEVDQRVNW